VVYLILDLLDLYTLILLIRVVLSWVNVSPYNPVARFLYRITDPVLDPIRRMLPSFGGLDISPLIVFGAVWLLKSLLLR
jgi:YggT family protein